MTAIEQIKTALEQRKMWPPALVNDIKDAPTTALTLKVLGNMADADLDTPSHAPEHLAPLFGTIGQCFSMVSLHSSFHAGQIADARHAAGRKSLFA